LTDAIKKSTTQPLPSANKTAPQRSTPPSNTAGRTASGAARLNSDSNAAPRLASSILDKNLGAVKKGVDTLDNFQKLQEGLAEETESSIDAAAKLIQGSLGVVSNVAETVTSATGRSAKTAQRAEQLATTKGRVDSAVGALEGGKKLVEGVQQLSEGNMAGLIDVGQGAVNLAKGAGESVVNVGAMAKKFSSETNRLVRLADRVGEHLQDGARVGKSLTVGGSIFGSLGGGAAILKGIDTFKHGDRTAGIGQVVSGASNVAESVSSLTAAVASKGSLAAKVGSGVGGRVVPILGVAGGLVQVGAAVTKTPPDTKAAATGLMNVAGSVLMPFPPVGTVVGGGLMAGAAIIDNWDAISGAASKAGSFVKGLFS